MKIIINKGDSWRVYSEGWSQSTFPGKEHPLDLICQ